jgi:uncharacterized protein
MQFEPFVARAFHFQPKRSLILLYLHADCSSMSRIALIVLALVIAAPALARVSFPPTPEHGVFHVDEVGVLRAAEAAEIDRIAGMLLEEQDVPILVVVLNQLAARGAAGYTIERYAAALFDHWGIGSQERNYGMLLLVSVGDRAARIELGAAWQHRYDDRARYVMDTLILPEFREGRYSEGMLAGVRGMDAMARGLELPSPRRPWWLMPAIFALFASVSGMSFSLMHSGRRGWAFALIVMLGMLLLMLMSMLGRGGGGGTGGGQSGPFRGGSSGGGGATGRW